MKIQRNISGKILGALKDTPVVLLHGARQTGKSTLVQWIANEVFPAKYLTMDDAGIFSAANSDPSGFLAGYDGPVVIDEVQLAPDLFRAIKLEVDRKRIAGRFLLTGSANVLLVPLLSESLAGRLEIHTLFPFSQGELAGYKECFIDALFQKTIPNVEEKRQSRKEFIKSLLTGGYPEVLTRRAEERRKAWFGAYITTILQRDIRNLADIEGHAQLPRLLSLLANQACSLLNVANLSRASTLAHTTLKRYLSLLQATFLVNLLPAWSGNVRKRLIKTPKVLFNDTGLLAYLLDLTQNRLQENSTQLGTLLENFVGSELFKQLTWSHKHSSLFYYRTAAGREVDYVIEDAEGRVAGIEVKASATVNSGDLKGLHDLAETVGKRFHRGIILYTGRQTIPFGKHLHALPVSALWRMGLNFSTQP